MQPNETINWTFCNKDESAYSNSERVFFFIQTLIPLPTLLSMFVNWQSTNWHACVSRKFGKRTEFLAGAQTCSRNFVATSQIGFHFSWCGTSTHITASNNSNNGRERPVDLAFYCIRCEWNATRTRTHQIQHIHEGFGGHISSNGDGVECEHFPFAIDKTNTENPSFEYYYIFFLLLSTLRSGMSYDIHITTQPMNRERPGCVSTSPTFSSPNMCLFDLHKLYRNSKSYTRIRKR